MASTDLRTVLARLLAMDLAEEPSEPVGPVKGFLDSRDSGIYFHGEAHDLLLSIERLVAKDALDPEGGVTPETVSSLVVQCYKRSGTDGPDAAIAWFEQQISFPSKQWRMFLSAGDVLFAGHALAIGGALVHGDQYPDDLGNLGDISMFQRDHPLPLIEVTVLARDLEAARTQAEARALEIKSVLALGAGRPERFAHSYVVRTGDSAWSFEESRRMRLSPQRIQDRDGVLRPGVRELSASMRLPLDRRDDWARRVLRAARWHYEMLTTGWHSLALMASMNALECLLLRNMRETGKGKKVAHRLTRLVPVAHMTDDEQRSWLRVMYSLRSQGVHEGLSVEQDLQVEALHPLVTRAVWKALDHLTPMHRDDGRACATYEEVWDQTLH